MTIQQDIQKVIIGRDSQLVNNSTNDKICMPKEIINLEEDIRIFSSFFRGIKFECYNRLINRDTGWLKRPMFNCAYSLYIVYSFFIFLFVVFNNIHFFVKKMEHFMSAMWLIT